MCVRYVTTLYKYVQKIVKMGQFEKHSFMLVFPHVFIYSAYPSM